MGILEKLEQIAPSDLLYTGELFWRADLDALRDRTEVIKRMLSVVVGRGQYEMRDSERPSHDAVVTKIDQCPGMTLLTVGNL